MTGIDFVVDAVTVPKKLDTSNSILLIYHIHNEWSKIKNKLANK